MAVNSYREDEFMENTDKKKIMRRLFSYLLAYKGTIIAVLVCMGITVAISLVNPLLIEEAIDHYIAQSDLHGLIGLGIFALVLNLIFIVMVKLRMYAMAVISNKILLQIRQDLYEHIQTLSFSFFDSRPTGKILARIIGDVNSLKDVLVNVVTTMVPEFVTVVGVVVIMLVKDWRLALASLSTIPLMIAGIWFVQTASHKRCSRLTIEDFPEPVAPMIPMVFPAGTVKLISERIFFPSMENETCSKEMSPFTCSNTTGCSSSLIIAVSP